MQPSKSNKVDKSNLELLEQGKVPPQAIELEEAVLGAMMLDRKGLDEALMVIRTPEVFYKEAHKQIFTAIQRLNERGNPVDLLTVSNELKAMHKLEDVGGDFYLISLSQKIASSAHIDFHSRILLQNYIKRKIIMFNAGVTALCYDDATDVFDLLDRWQKEFDNVNDLTTRGRHTMSFKDALVHLSDEIEVLSSNKDEVQLVGKTTGFQRTDKHTGGYRDQDLIIIAARPGMGKTAKVLKTIVENCKRDVPVGMISLEMSIHQLTARIVAIDTDFHLGQLLKTGFTKGSYFRSYEEHQLRMEKYKLIVDDSGTSDITEIVIMAKMWVRVHKIKLLVIDYLQLMTDKSAKGNREGEVSSISRRLKLLAKELNIPIIALSQLSRACETRGGSKRPLLSDLRESGAIEQDADIIEFIYRPDYYKIDMCEDDYEFETQKHCVRLGANTEIIYAKYRGGSTGTALLKWVGDKTKFIDVEDVNDVANYIEETEQPLPLGDPKTVFDTE